MNEGCENNTNDIIKNAVSSEYNLNYTYNLANQSKVIYKIIAMNEEKIAINKIFNYSCKNDKEIFKIIFENSSYNIYINNTFHISFNEIYSIEYINKKIYDMSIILPISFGDLEYNSLINFDFVLHLCTFKTPNLI